MFLFYVFWLLKKAWIKIKNMIRCYVRSIILSSLNKSPYQPLADLCSQIEKVLYITPLSVHIVDIKIIGFVSEPSCANMSVAFKHSAEESEQNQNFYVLSNYLLVIY